MSKTEDMAIIAGVGLIVFAAKKAEEIAGVISEKIETITESPIFSEETRTEIKNEVFADCYDNTGHPIGSVAQIESWMMGKDIMALDQWATYWNYQCPTAAAQIEALMASTMIHNPQLIWGGTFTGF